MTRFARARGSKASNERAPEDSTPWEVMKEQLLQAKKNNDDFKNRIEAEQKRIENYENFLKERKVQKRKATWCNFPVNENKEVSNTELPQENTKKSKKSKKKGSLLKQTDSVVNHVTKDGNEDNNYSDKPLKKSKKKNKKPQNEIESEHGILREVSAVGPVKTIKKNKKNKQENQLNESISEPDNSQNTVIKKKNKKNKQENQLNKSISEPDNSQNTVNQNDQNAVANVQQNDNTQKNKQKKNKKNKKLIDGKPVRRKAINDNSFQLIINGKEVELIRFDGFPVMKKDAERLQELKTSMIKKGIPKSEVQRTIKLERRRAEKALARVKREVCYNCRKGGHILSDCPDLKSKIPGTDGADGVCFKCGSTEHRQFECKVQRDKEFRFATCFICKEPGHIARQCPDNPKGLYPNGGSCKLCGDVTHLRKDCPTVMDKKENTTVKLQTLDSSNNIEDVGGLSNKFTPTENSKKPKKIRF